MLTATPLYAGFLTLLFLLLSANVVRGRYLHRVSVGDGGDKDLMKRMRAQANFVEYAPLGLLLIAFCEMQGLALWAVHALGLMLLLGRCLHAYGFGSTPQIVPLRRIGMVLTITALLFAALANIVLSLI